MKALERRYDVGARTRLMVLAIAALLLLPARAANATLPMSAEEPTAPAFTSHSDGEQVGGRIVVTVTSDAPKVLIAWESDTEWTQDYAVNVVEGEATAFLSTSGYRGPSTIVARDCRLVQHPPTVSAVCDGAGAALQVDVANGSPAFNEASWLDEWRGDFFVRVTEADETGPYDPWAWYGFFFDGEYVPGLDTSLWFRMEAGYLGDGTHTVQVAHCTESSGLHLIEPPVCDLANASEVRSFAIRTALHPTITRVRPRVISPDGNGIADRASVTMTVDTMQWVYWKLERGGETVASSEGLTERQPGPYTFSVAGRGDDDLPLRSGTYRLTVEAFTPRTPDPNDDDRQISGRVSTTLEIDRAAAKVSNVSARPRVLYPTKDGNTHRVRIAGTLSEPTSRLRVEILRDGTVRRTLPLGSQSGRFATSWAGHRPKGKLSVPGSYRYRFVATDLVGNQATRPGGSIEVRWHR
ncbi:MAG TPA: hypothetical protein VFD59_03545 [Nocardioidaceae bacterium]|nr:hypothetical protein [Nocardioidaceae bacterium]